MKLTEYLLVRFQERFGLPRWWVVVNLVRLAAVFGVVGAMAKGRGVMSEVVYATFLIILWSFPGEEKRAQEYADRNQIMVSNERRGCRFWKAMRWTLLVVVPLQFVPPIRPLFMVHGLCFLVAFHLHCADAFPMVGPTFRERLKALFAIRKTAGQELVVNSETGQ